MTKHGTFFWNELTTSNLRRSKSFYEKLIGWKTEAMPMPGGTYTLLKVPGETQPAGGAYQMPKGWGGPDMWMSYVAVDDVDASATKAKKLGGSVMKPPFDIPGVGRMCVITDPGGAHLYLITPVPMEAPPAKPKAKAASKAKPRKARKG